MPALQIRFNYANISLESNPHKIFTVGVRRPNGSHAQKRWMGFINASKVDTTNVVQLLVHRYKLDDDPGAAWIDIAGERDVGYALGIPFNNDIWGLLDNGAPRIYCRMNGIHQPFEHGKVIAFTSARKRIRAD